MAVNVMDADQKKLLGLGAIVAIIFVFLSITPAQKRTLRTWYKSGAWVAPVVAVAVIGPSAAIGVKVSQVRKQKAYMAAITQQVATGPTVLLLPRSDWKPVDPAKINLWGRLADALPHDEPISFEIFGSETEIAFALHGSENGVRATLTQVKAEWPGVQRRDTAADPTQPPEGWASYWCECAPATWDKPIVPLLTDPLRGALVELNGVVGRGRGLLQILAKHDYGTKRKVGQRAVAARGEGQQVPHAGVKALRTKEARELESRFDRNFLQVTVRAVGLADTPERAQGIARGLARAVCASYGPQNPVKVVKEGQDLTAIQQRTFGKSQAWADTELASLAHLVGSDLLAVAPRLLVASAKALPVSPAMRVIPTDTLARFAEEVR